jgi:hypothetical protein
VCAARAGAHSRIDYSFVHLSGLDLDGRETGVPAPQIHRRSSRSSVGRYLYAR